MANCFSLVWLVWQEGNVRIFEDKEKTEEEVWELFYFFSSLSAFMYPIFRGVPLLILQSNWLAVCV